MVLGSNCCAQWLQVTAGPEAMGAGLPGLPSLSLKQWLGGMCLGIIVPLNHDEEAVPPPGFPWEPLTGRVRLMGPLPTSLMSPRVGCVPARRLTSGSQ